MFKRTPIFLIIFAGLVFLFAIGFLLRWEILGQQAKPMWEKDEPVPFLLESGLQFRQVRTLAEGGKLPAHDPYIQVPRVDENGEVNWPESKAAATAGQGVDVAKTYSLGSEHAYAPLANLLANLPLTSAWPLERRVRWASVFFFCLAIPAIALWIGLLFRSFTGGAIAALFYALTYAAAVRSYGLDLSRENFALPWLALFFAALAWGQRAASKSAKKSAEHSAEHSANGWQTGDDHLPMGGNPENGPRPLLRPSFWIANLLAGAALAISIGNWDLIQYPVGMWFAWWVIRCCFASDKTALRTRPHDIVRLGLPIVGLVVAGLTDPYLSSHGFLLSPVMFLGYGALLGVLLRAVAPNIPPPVPALLALAPLVLFVLLGSQYTANYGHFGSLLSAKIAHLNVKPSDPAVLTYTQRIMWTPALNSTNWYALFHTLPYALYLSFGAIAVFAARLVSEEKRLPVYFSTGVGLVLLVLLDQRFGIPEILSPLSLLWVGILILLGVLWLRWLAIAPARSYPDPLDADEAKTLLPNDPADPERVTQLVFLSLVSLVTFMLFFRFHVFAIFFLSGLLGASAALLLRRRGGVGAIVWAALLVLGATMEMQYTLSDPTKTDRPGSGSFIPVKYSPDGPVFLARVNVQHDEIMDLVKELKRLRSNHLTESGRPPILLANFGLSASLLGLVELPIVLHPKFETPEIRERCQTFAERLYTLPDADPKTGRVPDAEMEFRDWSEEFGVTFYIHQRYDLSKSENAMVQMNADGTLAQSRTLINTTRYMVDALDVPDGAVARRFEHGFTWPREQDAEGNPAPPTSTPPRFYQLLYQNSLYRIFRVVSHRDYEVGMRLARDARMHLEIGQVRRAMDKATQVIRHYDPQNEIARRVVENLVTLLYGGAITQEDLRERIKNVYEEIQPKEGSSTSERPSPSTRSTAAAPSPGTPASDPVSPALPDAR